MRYIMIWGLLMFLTVCTALPRGNTYSEVPEKSVVVGKANIYPLPEPSAVTSYTENTRDEWFSVASQSIDMYLRPTGYLGYQYNPTSQSYDIYTNQGSLTSTSLLAIAKVPHWMRMDLKNILLQLTESQQETWAGMIANAVDPYIDEIAFAVAHSSLRYLTSQYGDPQMFVENAEKIYQIDSQLAYVDVMDHGTSTSDEDYYSTTRYRSKSEDGTVTLVEVPRDIYYWYIVHPKISDEIPGFIDPSMAESNNNHANNLVAPPTGQFWRSFFYNVQEDSFPQLSAMLQTCQNLRNWDGTTGDAVTTVQSWINAIMTFNSGTERPHQPVRIYRKHMGRCGEYADFTAAAARTALIPCTSILSSSTDHTWNEFWEGRWVQWEPVNGYIDVPLTYENGWGKVFGSVFEIRSDGFLTSVTERYSTGHATIHIHVADSLAHPVDGARILLAINDGGTIKTDMAGFTDNDGNCTFPVGENRHFVARVESSAGICPSPVGTYLDLVENTDNGGVYSFVMTINGLMPYPQISSVSVIEPSSTQQMVLSLHSPYQVVSGVVTWDDLGTGGVRPEFYQVINQAGDANIIMADPDNALFYQLGQTGDLQYSLFEQSIVDITQAVSITQPWMGFIDNSLHVKNLQYIQATLMIQHYGVSNEEQELATPTIGQLSIFPNPFKEQMKIRYSIARNQPVTFAIYNLKGQRIRELHSGSREVKGELVWDGRDEWGKQVGTGIYLYQFLSGDSHLTGRILHLH